MTVESSPGIATGDTQTTGEVTKTDVNGSQPSASSPETKDSGQKATGSMLDAVVSALKPSKGADEGSPASQTQDPKTNADPNVPKDDEPREEQLPEEVTEEELNDQKPKTRKRIEQLLGKVRTLGSQVTDLSPKAQEFDKLVNFIADNGLSKQDLDATFEIVSAIRNDPTKAYKALTPIYQALQQAVGDILPTELQERVRLGYISEADARALHRAQRSEALTREQSERTEQRRTEQSERERKQTLVRDVSSTVGTWEQGKASSDPDWHLKQSRINELIRLKVYEQGYPDTKEAAVKLCNDVYDDVTKEIRRLSPKPQEKQAVNGNASSRDTAAEPKSILEAVQFGLRKTA